MSRISLRRGACVGNRTFQISCSLTIKYLPDKEVVGYYDDGLTVPDDITLLWTDDK